MEVLHRGYQRHHQKVPGKYESLLDSMSSSYTHSLVIDILNVIFKKSAIEAICVHNHESKLESLSDTGIEDEDDDVTAERARAEDPTREKENSVTIRGLTREFRKGVLLRRKRAVDNVSVGIMPGEVQIICAVQNKYQT